MAALDLQYFILRRKSIQLYRAFLREIKGTSLQVYDVELINNVTLAVLPKSERADFQQWVRHDFERHRHETDKEKIKLLHSEVLNRKLPALPLRHHRDISGPGSQQQEQHTPPPPLPPIGEENWAADLLTYTAAVVLIVGTGAWVKNSFNKDGTSKALTDKSAEFSGYEEWAREDVAFTKPSALWAMIRNLFLYPSSVRTPLRKALYHHYYSNADDSGALSEQNYLAAYSAALVALPEHSDEVVGIALQIASFYEDCSERRRPQSMQWYKRALKSLLTHARAQPMDWSSKVGLQRLRQVSHIAARLAELSEKEAPVNEFPQEAEQWYTYAFKTLALPEAKLNAHFDSLLAGTANADQDGQEVALAALPESKRVLLQPLLDNMTAFYRRYHADALVLPLSLQLLSVLPSDERDPLCRRGQVMNNMAEAFVSLWYQRGRKESALLEEASKWLDKAKVAREHNVSRSPECAECDVAIVNNQGRIHELHGDFVKAAEMYRRAVNMARAGGFLDSRREAQANVERMQDKI
ncbi:hypothetical protein RI367_004382 [Sorochytrium milnesiophthora]